MCVLWGSHYEYVLSLVVFICILKCTAICFNVLYIQKTLKDF